MQDFRLPRQLLRQAMVNAFAHEGG